jgi:hypothetical protein
MTGRRMNIHVMEFVGRRTVQGVQMCTVTTIGVGVLVVQTGLKAPAGSCTSR